MKLTKVVTLFLAFAGVSVSSVWQSPAEAVVSCFTPHTTPVQLAFLPPLTQPIQVSCTDGGTSSARANATGSTAGTRSVSVFLEQGAFAFTQGYNSAGSPLANCAVNDFSAGSGTSTATTNCSTAVFHVVSAVSN